MFTYNTSQGGLSPSSAAAHGVPSRNSTIPLIGTEGYSKKTPRGCLSRSILIIMVRITTLPLACSLKTGPPGLTKGVGVEPPVNGVEPSRPDWYTGHPLSRTSSGAVVVLSGRLFPENSKSMPKRTYRNPVIYARELREEMVRECLTRKQLAERHGVSSDRITQWLCLLTLPEDMLLEIEALGDAWERQVVTERQLRRLRRRSLNLHN